MGYEGMRQGNNDAVAWYKLNARFVTAGVIKILWLQMHHSFV